MKLLTNVKPLEIFISSSMNENNPLALELRGMLRTVGDRYELFNYTFIEARASAGDSDYEMEALVRDCHAIVMILHDDIDGNIREGILKEFAFAVEANRPIFMFVHSNFKPNETRSSIVRLSRTKKAFWNAMFSSNLELVNLIESSLIGFMMQTTRGELARLGKNNDESMPTADVVAGKWERLDDIIR